MKRCLLFSAAGIAVAVLLAGCGYFGKWFSEPQIVETEPIWIAPDAFKGLELSVQALGMGGQGVPFVPGQLIVKLKEGRFANAVVNALCSKHALQLKGRISPTRLILVKVPEGVELEQMKAKLHAEPDVEYVELNGVYQLFGQPTSGTLMPQHLTNDPFMPLVQWGLFAIDFHKIPATALPATAPAIAVVDTGVDYKHPDLVGKVILGPDYFDGDMDPMDKTGHGTHVTGIAAALTDNNVGVAGVSGKSQVLAVRVGHWGVPVFAGAAGIVYAADHTAVRVINLSWGGPAPFAAIFDAIHYATSIKGKIVVAAAGNSNTTEPMYPAAFPNVIAVGATDWKSWEGCPIFVEVKKTCYSNYGDYVDIAAPGHAIWSTIPGGGYADYSGTSMAAPFVAGAAALVWGKWPTLTRTQVEELLITTGRSEIAQAECPMNGDENGDNGNNNGNGTAFPSHVKHLNVYNAFAARMTMGPAGGALLGLVVDANTGLGLGGATITITRVGGGTSRTTTTRADGTFTVTNLPAGTYRVAASRSGYITTSDEREWRVSEGCFALLPFIALPRTQAANIYTVVLEWRGWCGMDELDSFLWLPSSLPDRNRYIVHFVDRGNMNVHPFARFLRDEPFETPFRAWVPLYVETLTFRAHYTGAYTFAVLDFWALVGPKEGGSLWCCSDAVVRLYRGSSLVGTYLVCDATGEGYWWKVFTVTGNTVTGENALTTALPGPYGWDVVELSLQRKQGVPSSGLPRGQFRYRLR